MPTLAGVTPKTPVGSVNRRSQEAASSTPPPMQCPRIAATVGCGKDRSAAWAARLSRRTSAIGSSGSGPLSRSAMSAPAQNDGPAPVTTSARTVASSASPVSRSGRAAHMPAVIALRFSGRSMVRTATAPSRSTRSRSPTSAQVVGAEGVALVRVAGGVAGREPLLPLSRRAVREAVLVDPAAAEVALDEVVPDPRGGVQRPVDVVLGDLGDQRLAGLGGHGGRGVRPHPGVAVGLHLEAHRSAGRAGVARLHLLVGAEQVLHVVAVLVGEHIGVDERPALGAELALQVVEEGDVDVHELVRGAVERPGAAGRAAALGVHLFAEEDGVGALVAAAEGLLPEVLDRVDLRDRGALHVTVGVGAALAVLLQLAVVRRPTLADPTEAGNRAGSGCSATAAAEHVDQHDHDEPDQAEAAAPHGDAAAPEAASAAAAPDVGDVRRVEVGSLVEPHLASLP